MVVFTITFHLSSDAKPFTGAEAFNGIRNKVALFFAKPYIVLWPAADYQVLYPANSPNAARQLPEHATTNWH
jgi:hypothetical protein